MHFTYVHIRFFKGYLYLICLLDTISLHSLLSSVAAATTATSVPPPGSGFSVYQYLLGEIADSFHAKGICFV